MQGGKHTDAQPEVNAKVMQKKKKKVKSNLCKKKKKKPTKLKKSLARLIYLFTIMSNDSVLIYCVMWLGTTFREVATEA